MDAASVARMQSGESVVQPRCRPRISSGLRRRSMRRRTGLAKCGAPDPLPRPLSHEWERGANRAGAPFVARMQSGESPNPVLKFILSILGVRPRISSGLRARPEMKSPALGGAFHFSGWLRRFAPGPSARGWPRRTWRSRCRSPSAGRPAWPSSDRPGADAGRATAPPVPRCPAGRRPSAGPTR